MQFLVGDGDCSLSEVRELNLRIVNASSKAEAIRSYKTLLCCNDEGLHQFIMDGFDGKFWFSTPKENAHFEATGEVLASIELFRRRVKIYFEDRTDLADVYLQYYFNQGLAQLSADTLNAISEFILIRKNEYAKIDAICLADIIPINKVSSDNSTKARLPILQVASGTKFHRNG